MHMNDDMKKKRDTKRQCYIRSAWLELVFMFSCTRMKEVASRNKKACNTPSNHSHEHDPAAAAYAWPLFAFAAFDLALDAMAD